jgi:predicted neuraminidase
VVPNKPLNLPQRLALGLLACALVVAVDISRRDAMPPAPRAVVPSVAVPSAPAKLTLKDRGLLPVPPATPSAHASNLLAMPAGHPSVLTAFWFAGTRESAPDVQIAESHFDRATQAWSAARFVANREVMGAALGYGLRRLGNPVSWLDPQGRIHLFVVATGLGGWAAGRIVHLVQTEEGKDPAQLTFAPLPALPLSWFWNISFLVRGAPLPLADGGMVLPVYFELGRKYPVALRFDAQGEFKGMTRISARGHLLQPTLLTLDASHWLALMRDQRIDGKVAVARTDNAGRNWRDLPDLALTNPDASIVALALKPNTFLLAHNSSPGSRRVLDLSQSANGLDWALLHNLDHGSAGDDAEFSYPAMTWADNSLWVSYTEHRRAIAWQRFAYSAAP